MAKLRSTTQKTGGRAVAAPSRSLLMTTQDVDDGARDGMATLITRWRRMVDDASSAVWDDLEAQEILDQHRHEFIGLDLTQQPQREAGEMVTKLYWTNGRKNLEEEASGSDAWRLYDTDGAEVSCDNVDYLLGLLRFDTDQEGAIYYLDGRSYDLNAAAAQGWRERMASKASSYDFEADGARYTRSQWFKHCLAMAEHYEAQREAGMVTLARSDVW